MDQDKQRHKQWERGGQNPGEHWTTMLEWELHPCWRETVKEWKGTAAEGIAENFSKPVRTPRLKSLSVGPSIPCSVSCTAPPPWLSSALLTAFLHNMQYLLVVLRSGAQNSQFWSTRFRFGGFTRINETHDERFQMLTFLWWKRRQTLLISQKPLQFISN